MKAHYPNQVWSYDFVHDSCLNGEVVKCLTVTDEFTKEALAIEIAGSFKAEDVLRTLRRLFMAKGWPAFLRSDNGPEFIAHDLRTWLMAAGAQTFYIPPGSPWNNGVAESFNSMLRDECLNMEAFSSRAEARVVIESWRRRYNEERPHSRLGYLTPNEFRCVIDLAQLGCSPDAPRALPPDPRDLSLWAPPVYGKSDTDKDQGFSPGLHRPVHLCGAQVASQRCSTLRRDGNQATICGTLLAKRPLGHLFQPDPNL
jgi:putative transposase